MRRSFKYSFSKGTQSINHNNDFENTGVPELPWEVHPVTAVGVELVRTHYIPAQIFPVIKLKTSGDFY